MPFRQDGYLANAIIETAQIIILVLDAEGRVVHFNPYMESLTGYELADVQGKDWFETFLPANDRNRIRSLFKTAISGIPTRGNVNPIVAKDGRQIQIEWYSKTLIATEEQVLLAIGQDITEELQAKSELREREGWLESILASLHESAIAVYDRDGFLNALWGCVELDARYGIRAADAVGQNLSDLLPPRQAEAVLNQLRRVCQTGEKVLADSPVTMPNGEFWQTVSMAPLRDAAGRTTGVVASYHDITERKRAESALQQLNAELESEVARRTTTLTTANAELQAENEVRRRTETKLRHSEERFRTLVSALPHGVAEVDLSGRRTFVNKTFARLFECEPDDLIGNFLWDFTVDEGNRDELRIYYLAAMSQQFPPTPFFGQYRTASGRQIDLQVDWDYRRDEAGRLLGTIAIVTDITERKAAEAELRLAAEIMQNMAEGVMLVRVADCAIVHTNPRFDEMFGYEHGELVEQHVTVLNAASEREPEELAHEMITSIERSGVWTGEIHNVKKDGTEFWTAATISEFEHPHPKHGPVFVSVQSDISERKRISEELKAENQRRKDILNGMFGFVGLYTTDGILIEANQAPLDAAGLKKEDVIGRPFWDTYWWSYSTDVQEQLKDALARAACGETVRYDVPVRVADGRLIEIDVTFNPLYDTEGNVAQLLGFAVDISERKATERALVESQARLKALVDNLPGVVCRFLNTPKRPATFVSDGVRDITGYSAADFLGGTVHVTDLIHPDDTQKVWDDIQLALDQRQSYRLTYRLIDRDQNVRWLWENGAGVFSSDGTLLALEGFITDITSQTVAEMALEQSRKQLVEAQRIARLGNWNWDIAKNELIWSDEIYRIFGLKPQQFGATYEAFLKSVHPDDRGRLENAVRFALQNQESYNIDHRIVLPTGEIRFVHEQAVVKFGPDGKPIRMAGTVQDITDRRKAEHDLRLAAEILENAAGGVNLVRRSNGRIGFTNRKFDEMFGYSGGELIGQPVSILNADSVQPAEETTREIMAAVDKTGSWSGELRNVRKDGTEFWTSATVSRFHHLEYGEVLVTVQQDITARKHFEEQLQRSEAKFRMHFENNPVPIFCWQKRGDDFTLIDTNPAGLTYCGGEDVISRMMNGRLTEWYADLPQIREDFEACFRSRQPLSRELEYVFRTTGETRYLDVRYVHVPPDLVMVHTYDRTNERRIEEESRARQEQLAHAARLVALGEMASSIAHEINQPLTAIIAFADSLSLLNSRRDAAAIGPQVPLITKSISEQCQRAGAIIHRILQLSKRSRPHRTKVELNELVERVLSFLAHDDRLRSVLLVKRLSRELPEIHADPIQMEQVILNLTRNALDSMEDVPPSERMLEYRTFVAGDGSIGLSIRDSGKGIPEDQISSVFEVFVTTKPEGLGLGLAVSRSIMEAHDGRFEIFANPEGGVTFTMLLPANSDSR